MSATVTIASTSLRRFFRDRSNYFFVLILPILLVVAVGLQFGGAGAAGQVVLTGSGDLTDQLASELEDVNIGVDRQDDPDRAKELVARGRTDAAVVVDAAADAAWADGKPANVTVLPGSQANGQATTATVNSVLNSLSGRQAALNALGGDRAASAKALDGVSDVGPTLKVTSVGDDLGEEFSGLGRFDLGAAQQLSLFMFLSALTGSTLLIQSRELGVTRRALSAPVTPLQVIGGEALGRFAIALAQGLYVVIGTAVLFGVDWGNPLATSLVVAAFAGVRASAAMVLGSLMDNAQAATGLGIGLGMVVAALGGSMLPLELFPDGLLKISAFTPHHWAYEAYSEIQRRGGGVADVLPQLGVLFGMTALLLPLGAWLLRRSLSRAL